MLTLDTTPYLSALDAEMRAAVSPSNPLVARFYDMMRYHLGWADEQFRPAEVNPGKRLRPLFCLLTAEAVGGDWRHALPAAAAVEMLHNFSLVHDDIEDNDRTRRHRPTLWTLVGIPHAINAGDALFAIAQRSLLRLSDRGVPAERTLRIARVFQETCVRLVEGQYLDMHGETMEQTDEDYYLQMIAGKTAALLGASTAIGAAVATDDEPTIEMCRHFGEELGIAFQIRDDELGLWGDPAITGKPAGADLKRKKKSLPIIYARSEGGALAEMLEAAFTRPEPTESEVGELLRLMERAGIRERAQAELNNYLQSAMKHWRQALPLGRHESEAGNHLATMVKGLAQRIS